MNVTVHYSSIKRKNTLNIFERRRISYTIQTATFVKETCASENPIIKLDLH